MLPPGSSPRESPAGIKFPDRNHSEGQRPMLGMLAASRGRSPVFAPSPFDENDEEYGCTGGL